MRIGYIAEDTNHDCTIQALCQMICADDEIQLVQADYHVFGTGKPGIVRALKGKTDRNRRISLLKYVFEQDAVQGVVIMVDSDNGYKETLKILTGAISAQYQHKVLICIASRNVECWFLSDPTYNTKCFGIGKLDDPKEAKKQFKNVMGITARNRKREKVIRFIDVAPLHEWYKRSPSFKKSYDAVRLFGKAMECSIPPIAELQ